MICLKCKNLDLKSFPKITAIGFGKCKKDSLPGCFVSITYERVCEKYVAAPDATVEKRQAWASRVFGDEKQ